MAEAFNWQAIIDILVKFWIVQGCSPEQARENAAIQLRQWWGLACLVEYMKEVPRG